MRLIAFAALLAGCGATTSTTPKPPPAEHTAAPVAQPTATASASATVAEPPPTASASAGPVSEAFPCSGKRCELTEISDATAQQIDSKMDHDAVDITFVEGATNAGLKTVGKLPWLRNVHIRSKEITDLSPLAALERLNELDLVGAEGVSDLSAIAKLATLTAVSLEGTKVTDLAPLAGLTSVEELGLQGTPATNIAPLRGMKSLRVLNLKGVKAADWKPLTDLAHVETLTVDASGWKNLNPLAGMTKLRRLELAHNEQVKDISTLMHMKDLESLDLTGAPLADVLPLGSLTKLETVLLGGTKVTSFRGLLASANSHALRKVVVPKGTAPFRTEEIRNASPSLKIEEE